MRYGFPHRHALLHAARVRRGMGASEPGADPVVTLISQVNRFTGPDAPSAYRMAEAPYGIAAGNIAQIAPVAVVIYQRSATDSYNQYHDRGSAQAIDKANKAFADPVGFVSTNMAEVTTMIASLADSIGLPPAVGEGGGMPRTLLIIGGIAVAAWMLSR